MGKICDAIGRDLPFAPGAGEGADINFGSAGLIGLVGDPAAIGRERKPKFTEARAEKDFRIRSPSRRSVQMSHPVSGFSSKNAIILPSGDQEYGECELSLVVSRSASPLPSAGFQ